MNNSRLIERTLRALNSCVDREDLIEELNIGMRQVSGLVLFPELIATSIITTLPGVNSISLPVEFQRTLFACSEENRSIAILNSKKRMLTETNGMPTSGNSGQISFVAVEGRNLLYYPAPAESTVITIGYYRKPDEIKDNTNETIIPLEFQKIIFHYALYSLFDEIEDGIEGKKVNTIRHESKYHQYLDELKAYYSEGVSMAPVAIVKGEFY